jgi:hypothetical protein
MAIYRKGSSGAVVSNIQTYLNKCGYPCVADGEFGDNTDKAVRDFQRDNELTIDGIVGPKTIAILSDKIKNGIKKICEEDYQRAANELGCEVAIIKAILKIESSGSGFLMNGLPKILFEGHVFWNQLKKVGKNPLTYFRRYPNILYEKWTKKNYFGGEKEYTRLNTAKDISVKAANMSTSWGLFQIMGFNYEACGEPNIYSFVAKMYESEGAQLDLFIKFIENNQRMHLALLNKDWVTFARLYNGAGYAQNQYDKKLAAAYKFFSNGNK